MSLITSVSLNGSSGSCVSSRMSNSSAAAQVPGEEYAPPSEAKGRPPTIQTGAAKPDVTNSWIELTAP
jgi:hypothetical protein